MLKNFAGNEVIDSINEVIKERIVGHMYGTFFLSWCLVNWQAIYITLFIDSELLHKKEGLLKIEYLSTIYPTDSWQAAIQSSWLLLLFPALLVYIAQWILSELDLIVHKKWYSQRIKKVNEQMKQNKILLTNEEKVLQKQTSVLKAKSEKQKVEKSVDESNEQSWENDYKELKNNKIFAEAMDNLESCLYEYYGYNDADPFKFAAQELALIDINGLINLSSQNGAERVTLTEKGKYVLKRHIDDRSTKNE